MKNYLLGAGFLVLAFYLIWQQGAEQIEYSDRLLNKEVSEQTQRVEGIEGNSPPYLTTPDIEPGIINSEDSTPFAAVVQLGEEKLTDGLSTNLSSITFSNHTGAIRSVQLHESERLNKAYDIEHSEQPLLGIAFEDESGALLSEALLNPRGFRLIESSPSRVVYRW